MIIRRFEASGFRNLDGLVLEPHPVLTFLIGKNGSGKSSVLEAIQCLATGHGFRSRRYRDHLAHDAVEYVLRADLLAVPRPGPGPDGGADGGTGAGAGSADGNAGGPGVEHRCGVRRGRDGTLDVRLDYASAGSFAEVARVLPVKVLTPDSHLLIQGGPEERRRFLDWGCFHADESFHPAWRRYRRALSQRNELLRAGAPDGEVRAWDSALAEDGDRLQVLRAAYLARLARHLQRRTRDLGFVFHVELELRSGWSRERSLADALERNLELHRRMRTTTDGPHRAELLVKADGHGARDVLSRGQQKLLVYLMHLAQLDDLGAGGTPAVTVPRDGDAGPEPSPEAGPRTVPAATVDAAVGSESSGHGGGGLRPVVLCDDLGSELDADAGGHLLRALVATGSQVIVTGVALPPPGDPAPRGGIDAASGDVEAGVPDASALAIHAPGTTFGGPGSIDPSPAFAVFELSAGRILDPTGERVPPEL